MSCHPSGNNHQQEMSVQINQEKMFSSQVSALFTQDTVQAVLRRGHSYRSLILQATERHMNLVLWLSPCQQEHWVMPLSPTPDLPQESTVPQPVKRLNFLWSWIFASLSLSTSILILWERFFKFKFELVGLLEWEAACPAVWKFWYCFVSEGQP